MTWIWWSLLEGAWHQRFVLPEAVPPNFISAFDRHLVLEHTDGQHAREITRGLWNHAENRYRDIVVLKWEGQKWV